MRWHPFAAAVLAVAAAGPASAQSGPERRFTDLPNDTNRNNKLIYVPLAMGASGPKPAGQPYDVAAAAWYGQPLGTAGAQADKVLDKSRCVLERFDSVRGSEGNLLRVIVTQRPAAPDAEPPMIRVVEAKSMLSASALAHVEPLSDGARYTFLVRHPSWDGATAPSFEIHLLPGREVKLPRYLVGAPTFVRGADRETRALTPPPRLPLIERVAGKRIEYRSGRVVDQKPNR